MNLILIFIIHQEYQKIYSNFMLINFSISLLISEFRNSSEFFYLSLLFHKNIKYNNKTIYSYKNLTHKAKVKFLSLVLISYLLCN